MTHQNDTPVSWFDPVKLRDQLAQIDVEQKLINVQIQVDAEITELMRRRLMSPESLNTPFTV